MSASGPLGDGACAKPPVRWTSASSKHVAREVVGEQAIAEQPAGRAGDEQRGARERAAPRERGRVDRKRPASASTGRIRPAPIAGSDRRGEARQQPDERADRRSRQARTPSP